MTRIIVRAVDGSSQKYAALLQYLQLESLPGDDPMETTSGHWWVAFENRQPIAFAGLVQSQQYPSSGYLCRAGVLPSHRGKGLQRRLIKAREKKAKELGWSALYSDTYNNPQSSNNLIRCGYRMHTPRVPYGFRGASYWKKSIT